jgi:hypothetical protein
MNSALKLEMEERFAPSRPYRLGTRRRRAPRREPYQAVGASRPRGARATSLDTEKLLVTSVQNRLDESLTEKDLYYQQEVLRHRLNQTLHKIWQAHAAAGNFDQSARWEKAWFQVHNCQMEWVGYRAGCCGDRSKPIAVPIGCNHRLCPMCAWHRSQKARVRIKTLFDRLTHPVMITLTIPNQRSIRKHDYTLFRQRVRRFIAQHKAWIKGGVYSLETTYNRAERSWHVHCHILADVAASLPTKENKIALAGQRVCLFTAIKLRLEFDWMRLWAQGWGKKARRGASAMSQAGDQFDFSIWVARGRENRLGEWRDGGYKPIRGLSDPELEARTRWNAENRRVIDLRPVLDREGAAREVLKYITKCADFCDLPEAVEVFCDAVRGARLIQTFGSWYGVQLDTVFDPEHMDDWGEMKCACGLNHWQRMGVFYRSDVEMDPTGRWFLKRSLTHTCRGTVPRPTVRWLGEPPEEIEDTEWQTR